MPSSDGGDNVRADVELENMKAHTFSDGSATLRRRNGALADGENILILEKVCVPIWLLYHFIDSCHLV